MAACGSDTPTKRATDNAQGDCSGDELGQDCDCDDQNGTTICNDDGEIECQCEEPVSSKRDAGRDAGKDAGKVPVRDAATTRADSATADDTETQDAGETASDSGSTPIATSSDPILPEPTGTCPDLKSGTATIGGLGGITVVAGNASKSGGPLIFYWHGTGSSAGEYQFMLPAAVQQEITAAGGIIISPQSSLGTGSDISGTGIFHADDFKVMDLIAACAVKNNGIDPHKIYTTGCSAGGLTAGAMGMMRSNYIAASAPNSGGEVFPQKQQGSHTPALMTMHGGSSDMVIVTFSETSKTADTQYKSAGGFVMNCNHGGGHCQAPAALQSAAWEFMKAHPFGVDPEPYTTVPSSFPKYCTIF